MEYSLYALLGFYTLYVLVKIYISLMQYGLVVEKRKEAPVLLEEKNWKIAAEYEIAKEKFSINSSLYDLFIFFLWIGFGLDMLNSVVTIEDELMKAVVFINLFLVVNYVLTLPFSIYEKFGIDSKFGFNNTTKKLFITDEIKSGLIGLTLTSVIVYLMALFITSTESWWLYSFFSIFALIILINMLFPTIRALMFDKFVSIDETELGTEIRALLKREGFTISGIFKVDASKRDSRLNAYFGGLGKTKRVVLYDTLIEKLTVSELLAVLGHELGHFKHKDIIKNIAVMGAMLFAILALFGNVPTAIYESIGLESSASVLIVMFMIFSTPIFFFAMPFINMLSRENEFAADEFGGAVESKEALASALIKLSNENKKFPISHKLYKIFYETHPGVVERVEKLRGEDTPKKDTRTQQEIDIVNMALD